MSSTREAREVTLAGHSGNSLSASLRLGLKGYSALASRHALVFPEGSDGERCCYLCTVEPAICRDRRSLAPPAEFGTRVRVVLPGSSSSLVTATLRAAQWKVTGRATFRAFAMPPVPVALSVSVFLCSPPQGARGSSSSTLESAETFLAARSVTRLGTALRGLVVCAGAAVECSFGTLGIAAVSGAAAVPGRHPISALPPLAAVGAGTRFLVVSPAAGASDGVGGACVDVDVAAATAAPCATAFSLPPVPVSFCAVAGLDRELSRLRRAILWPVAPETRAALAAVAVADGGEGAGGNRDGERRGSGGRAKGGKSALTTALLSPQGVLLHGPPGCGKTLLARRLAWEAAAAAGADVRLFAVDGSTPGGAQGGSTDAALRRAFESAGMHAYGGGAGGGKGADTAVGNRFRLSIVFIDEIDAICPARDGDGGRAASRATGQLLTLMDGVRKGGGTGKGKGREGGAVAVLAATNRVNALDAALRRPGRFGVEVLVSPPDARRRRAILATLLRDMLRRAEQQRGSGVAGGAAGGAAGGVVGGVPGAWREERPQLPPLRFARDLAESLGRDYGGGDDALSAIATRAVGFVGADLAAVCRRAAMVAMLRSLGDSGSGGDGKLDQGARGAAAAAEPTLQNEDISNAVDAIGASSLRAADAVKTEAKAETGDAEKEKEKEKGKETEKEKERKTRADQDPFAALGGLGAAKHRLEMAVLWPLRHPETFARLGLSKGGGGGSTAGVILHGPPGCGKTALVRCAAAAAGATLVTLASSDIFSPFVGAAEAAVRRAFAAARAALPAIIFIDEIDCIAGGARKGGGGGGGGTAASRVLSTLLNEMDGVGIAAAAAAAVASTTETVPADSPASSAQCGGAHTNTKSNRSVSLGLVVIAATNRIDRIDQALLRPGRFGTRVFVGPPSTEAEMAEVLRAHTERRGVPLSSDAKASLFGRDGGGVERREEGGGGGGGEEVTDNKRVVSSSSSPAAAAAAMAARAEASASLAERMVAAGMTGADAEQVCRRASLLALRELFRSSGSGTEDLDCGKLCLNAAHLRRAFAEHAHTQDTEE